MMRLLIIEDDPTVVSLLQEALEGEDIEWTVASTGNQAMHELETGAFDLLVCDLRLPLEVGDEPIDDVGISVLDRVAESIPGVSAIVLSGFADITNIGKFQRAGVAELLGGARGFRVSDAFRKRDFDPPIARIREYAAHYANLRRVELASGVKDLSLSHHREQVIRSFVVRQRGTRARLEPVIGGMSSTSKVRVTVMDDDGMVLSQSIARIDSLTQIADEKERYENCITALPAGSFAHLVAEVNRDAGADGGLFYKLADQYDRSLLDLVEADPVASSRAVARLEAFEASWGHGATTGRVSIRDIRRLSIADDRFLPIADRLERVDWETIEAHEVVVPKIRQHGDLHVFNVLARADGEPHLIDFAEAGMTLGPIDPVTLELSLVFHRDARARMGTWPSEAAAENWTDVRRFADGAGHEPFVVACREWSHRLAGGDRAVYASAYGYAVRQLQYSDVDPAIVSAIVRSIADEVRGW